MTSWIMNLISRPSSPLLFNLLLSFPSFFTICLFLHLSPSLSQNQPCCDSRYVVQCSEIIHASPSPSLSSRKSCCQQGQHGHMSCASPAHHGDKPPTGPVDLIPCHLYSCICKTPSQTAHHCVSKCKWEIRSWQKAFKHTLKDNNIGWCLLPFVHCN